MCGYDKGTANAIICIQPLCRCICVMIGGISAGFIHSAFARFLLYGGNQSINLFDS